MGKSPLIFIAPFQVNYTNNPNAAPFVLAARTKTAITNMMDAKIMRNSTRLTQDSHRFKIGSGMPAYVIGINVDAVVYDASVKEMVATTKGYVADHPSGSMKVLGTPGRARQQTMTRPPRDDEKLQLLVDAAESGTETAIKWILQTHP